MRNNIGYSVSTWKCVEHPEEKVEFTWLDVVDKGTPICPICGDDMDFISEEWETL
jgi:hypothetical protein